LQVLNLARCQFNDLPAEVCGEHDWQNVVDKVRAHYEDLKSGQQNDAEVKVFLLGNGGVGKTQLCRRLRGLEFDDRNVSSTHGIQLSDITLSLEGFSEPVRLNFWDFGGQEIYHGSHALFLHGQAIFLVLWTPELEQGETYQESGLTLRHRPLTYWLDYLRAFAWTDASPSSCKANAIRAINAYCVRPLQRMIFPFIGLPKSVPVQGLTWEFLRNTSKKRCATVSTGGRPHLSAKDD
jgi:internalin A